MSVKAPNGASGFLSNGAIWTGGVAPVDGDTISAIPAGCHIVLDKNLVLGSSAANVGDALTIAGAVGNHGSFDISTFQLTLSGTTAANRPLVTSAYGELINSSGGTLLFDVAIDLDIPMNGILTAMCVANAKSKIGIVPTRLNWNNAGGVAYTTAGNTGWYDALKHLMFAYLGNVGIANAAGSALGSFGDSSLSFSAITPAGALTTPVASIAAVIAAGQYYVDHMNGYLYFFQTALGISAFTPAYKYLTYKSVCFNFFANANGNQCKVQNVDHSYIGNINNGGDDFAYYFKDKAKTGTERDVQVSDSTFTLCKRLIGTQRVNGTSKAVPMNFKNNFVYGIDGDAYGLFHGVYRANNSYLDFTGCSVRGACLAADHATTLSPVMTNVSTSIVQTGLVYSHMAMHGAEIFNGAQPLGCTWTDCEAVGGIWWGAGSAGDTRLCENFGGVVGLPAVINSVIFAHGMRNINVGLYTTILNPIMIKNYHHSINGPTSQNDILVPGMIVKGMLRLDATIGGAAVEEGYNKRQAFDNASITNCTDVRSSSFYEFGDVFDVGGGANVRSRTTLQNNLSTLNAKGFRRIAATAARCYQSHFAGADFNAVWNNTADYTGWNRWATFTGIVNCTGIALNNPSLATAQVGKALVYTYNSATDRTLSWDGGAAIQLVQFSGALTTGGADAVFSGTVSDSGKAFNVNLNNAACPVGSYIVMTSGVLAGQVRRITNNTATQITSVDIWGATKPAIGDTYVIILSEVTLTAANAVDTVLAGIYVPSLPASTQTDAAVGCTTKSFSADPMFFDPTRTLDTWDLSMGGSGTEEGAYNRLFANPYLAFSSLFPYLRIGYSPTNPLYHGTASDGGDIGATPFYIPPSTGRRHRRLSRIN